MEPKLSTTLQLFINKELTLNTSTLSDKFIIPEPDVSEEPKMQILEKPIPNNSESMELF